MVRWIVSGCAGALAAGKELAGAIGFATLRAGELDCHRDVERASRHDVCVSEPGEGLVDDVRTLGAGPFNCVPSSVRSEGGGALCVDVEALLKVAPDRGVGDPVGFDGFNIHSELGQTGAYTSRLFGGRVLFSERLVEGGEHVVTTDCPVEGLRDVHVSGSESSGQNPLVDVIREVAKAGVLFSASMHKFCVKIREFVPLYILPDFTGTVRTIRWSHAINDIWIDKGVLLSIRMVGKDGLTSP
jgi:hypothetical protein